MKRILRRLKNLFSKRFEYFYILDFGRSSIKLALAQLDKHEKHADILKIVKQESIRHQGAAEGFMNTEHAAQTIRAAFRKLGKINKSAAKANDVMLGMASEMVHGYNYSYVYKRDNPKSKIDLRELKNALHNAEVKAYEEIRKKFVKESGYSARDVVLINSMVQEIKVDGYKVKNPIGFEGSEIHIVVFNAYLPTFYKNVFEEAVSEMKLNMRSVIYEPYAVFKVLKDKLGDEFEALIVDIGGKTTRVSLVRKGRLEEVKTFSFGGESFTKRIASHFSIGFWEAEDIKTRYARGNVSDSAKKVIESALQPELTLFLSALEMILKDFSKTAILPGDIYIYGGGGNIPLMDSIIRKRKWKRDLSFIDAPKIKHLAKDDFKGIALRDTDIVEAEYISILALAHYLLVNVAGKDTIVDKTLKRMVQLIQN